MPHSSLPRVLAKAKQISRVQYIFVDFVRRRENRFYTTCDCGHHTDYSVYCYCWNTKSIRWKWNRWKRKKTLWIFFCCTFVRLSDRQLESTRSRIIHKFPTKGEVQILLVPLCLLYVCVCVFVCVNVQEKNRLLKRSKSSVNVQISRLFSSYWISHVNTWSTNADKLYVIVCNARLILLCIFFVFINWNIWHAPSVLDTDPRDTCDTCDTIGGYWPSLPW